MSSPPEPPLPAPLERRKEVEHAHQTRSAREHVRTGVGLALSLRFLRTIVARLGTPTTTRPTARVLPPPAGTLAVTLVGHATVMLTTSQTRVLTDPCFTDFLWGLRRAEAACLDPRDAAEVGLVLISHAHRDHLHPASLRRLPRAATVVVPPGCASLVERLGFARVVVLEPGGELAFRDLIVTAVAARHDGSRGFGDLTWRAACGYVVRAPEVTAYFAGDTGYFSGFADLGRRLRPDVALLPIAGYEPLALRDTHMSPLDAVAAFEDLGAHLLVPIAHGAFPLGYEPLEAPVAWLQQLCAERGHAAKLAALRPGETCLVRRPAARQDGDSDGVMVAVDGPTGVG